MTIKERNGAVGEKGQVYSLSCGKETDDCIRTAYAKLRLEQLERERAERRAKKRAEAAKRSAEEEEEEEEEEEDEKDEEESLQTDPKPVTTFSCFEEEFCMRLM